MSQGDGRGSEPWQELKVTQVPRGDSHALSSCCIQYRLAQRGVQLMTGHAELVLPFCLFFLQKPSMFDISREMGSSVALYSRKILIQTKAADILPKWLRFLRGVCWEQE